MEEKNEIDQQMAEIEPAIESPAETEATAAEAEVAIEPEEVPKDFEKYFGNYPETLGMLSEDKEFKIGDETAVFLAMTEGYARGSGIDNPTIDKCLKELFAIGRAARNGGFTIDQLETVMKGLDHDSLLEKATREAELRGRNAAIEEDTPDEKEPTSDGIPHLGAAQMRSPSTSRDSIFQLAQGAR